MLPKDAYIDFDLVSIVINSKEPKTLPFCRVSADKRRIYVGASTNFSYRWSDVESLDISKNTRLLAFKTTSSGGALVTCEGASLSQWQAFSEFTRRRWRKEGKNLQSSPEEEETDASRPRSLASCAPRRRRVTYGRRGPRTTTARNFPLRQQAPVAMDDVAYFSSDDEWPGRKNDPASVEKDRIQYDDDDDDHIFETLEEAEGAPTSGRPKKTSRPVIQDDASSDEETVIEEIGLTTPVRNQRVVTPRFSLARESADAETTQDDQKMAPPESNLISNFFGPKKTRHLKSPVLQKSPTMPEAPVTPKRTPLSRSQNCEWISGTPTTSSRKIISSPLFHPRREDEEGVDSPDESARTMLSHRLSIAKQRLVEQESNNTLSTSQQRRRFILPGQSRVQLNSLVRFRANGSMTKADAALDSVRSPVVSTLDHRSPLLSHTPPRRLLGAQTKPATPLATPNCLWRGLRNLGNTCYCNAALQMLMSVPSFVVALAQVNGGTLTKSLSSVFAELNIPNEGLAVDPRAFKKAVDTVTHRFFGLEQRDAHEFLSDLIDRVHDELEETKKMQEKDSSKENDAIAMNAKSCTGVATQPDDILPTDFFRLEVEVCLECDSCGYFRKMKEMYRHLSLDMDDEVEGVQGGGGLTPWSVEKGLAMFFRPEKRELNCEKCKDGKTATQTLRVVSCPNVLLLHLKRFKLVEHPRSLPAATETGENKEDEEAPQKKVAAVEITFHKNKAPVKIEQKLSLARFVASDKEVGHSPARVTSPQYKLVSVAKHIGSNAFLGHYTADCMRTESPTSASKKEWFTFDDGKTDVSTEEQVLDNPRNQKNAYMLLYRAE